MTDTQENFSQFWIFVWQVNGAKINIILCFSCVRCHSWIAYKIDETRTNPKWKMNKGTWLHGERLNETNGKDVDVWAHGKNFYLISREDSNNKFHMELQSKALNIMAFGCNAILDVWYLKFENCILFRSQFAFHRNAYSIKRRHIVVSHYKWSMNETCIRRSKLLALNNNINVALIRY